MRMDEIRAIARERGIKTRNMKKEELIRAILAGEGYGDRGGGPNAGLRASAIPGVRSCSNSSNAREA